VARLRLGKRTLLAALAAALVIAAGFGVGYALASGGSAGSEAEADGSAATAAAAVAESWSQGLERGVEAGAAAGEKRGAAEGDRKGREAALATISDTDGSGQRSESRSDIDYDGQAGPNIDGAGGVLVVGDSLEVLSSPYLAEYLPSSVDLTINVEGGYSSLQIFELFEQAYDPSQSVIVFDAGTNDNPHYPEILAERLEAVAEIVGNRCMVVPTIHGLVVDGLDSSSKNRVVQQFAASRPGTQVPDWAGAVAEHPELMQPDNLHPIPEGAALRAKIIAQGIEACLTYG